MKRCLICPGRIRCTKGRQAAVHMLHSSCNDVARWDCRWTTTRIRRTWWRDTGLIPLSRHSCSIGNDLRIPTHEHALVPDHIQTGAYYYYTAPGHGAMNTNLREGAHWWYWWSAVYRYPVLSKRSVALQDFVVAINSSVAGMRVMNAHLLLISTVHSRDQVVQWQAFAQPAPSSRVGKHLPT
jgi:hypothetical protein